MLRMATPSLHTMGHIKFITVQARHFYRIFFNPFQFPLNMPTDSRNISNSKKNKAKLFSNKCSPLKKYINLFEQYFLRFKRRRRNVYF